MKKSALAIAALVLAGTTAHADQTPPPAEPVAESPQQARAALNQSEADAAAQQLSQDQANQQHHDAAMTHWENKVDAYHDAARDHRAETAQYHDDMAQWHADVAACKAGDTSRCAPKP